MDEVTVVFSSDTNATHFAFDVTESMAGLTSQMAVNGGVVSGFVQDSEKALFEELAENYSGEVTWS